MKVWTLGALSLLAACGGMDDFETSETDAEASAAEAKALGSRAVVWRNTATLESCGEFKKSEDFSSGRYSAHRFRTVVSPDGPVEVELRRSGGTFDPAIIVATREGTVLFNGTTSTPSGGVEVTLLEDGRGESSAVIAIEASDDATVDVYVTGWSVVDSRFAQLMPRSAKYELKMAQSCDTSNQGFQGVYDGIQQRGSQIPRKGLSNATLEGALGVAVEPYGDVTSFLGHEFVSGKVSHFGGASDTGVSATERGAISGEILRNLNVPANPTQAELDARPGDFYFAAMRFNYSPNGRTFWAGAKLLVVNPRTGASVVVRPADWGPGTRTARIIDLSPQAIKDLGMNTDDVALVSFAVPGAKLGKLPAVQLPSGPGTQPTPPAATCPAGVVCIDQFPWIENGDTRQGRRGLNGYGCAPGANESGPENLYKLVVPSDGFLSAEISGVVGGVDVDVHLLSAASASACIDRGDLRTGSWVTAGEYWVAVDTWVSAAGVELAGTYTLTFGLVTVQDLKGLGIRQIVAERALRAFSEAFANGTTDKLLYTIADLDLPSDQRRLFTVNLVTGELLYNLYVAHGSGSADPNDRRMARRVSNISGSNMSSAGLMKTSETYTGDNGYSLRLDGLETGFNDNVRSRAIVFHGASYATPDFVRSNGYTGRSSGCPAIDSSVSTGLINQIKGGTLYFSHFSDASWLAQSEYLR